MAASLQLSLTRFLCLSLAAPSLFATLSAAAPWIVTANYEEVVTVYSAYTYDYGDYTEPAQTYTEINTITSPSGSAISTSTITETDYEGDTMTIVEVLYPYTAAATPTSTSSDAYATTSYNENLYTYYYVNVTYTAPTGCSSTWTYTTAADVQPPYAIQDALVPTSVSTSYYTDNSSPFQPTVITQVNAYLDPSQVPASSMSELSSEYAPSPTCFNPAETASETSSSATSTSFVSDGNGYSCNIYGYCYYDGGDGTSWINDSSIYGISPLAIILISVLGWTFVVFVIGLFENYFHFQRLMKGWQARRGLPITWLLWAFPLSCLVCCLLSRRGFQARSEEDAAELRKQWQERGFWNKMKLWLRYGFTVGYPSVLQGPAPPRVGRPSKKPTKPTKPLLQVTPPASETADISRELTPRSDGGNADLENADAAPALPQRPQTQMSGGLPIIVTPPPLTTVAEDEITAVPDVPTTTHSHQAEEAAEKQVSEKGE